jgi:hypothetical protein
MIALCRSRSRTRARRSPKLERIDSYTMDLFKTSLRKCLEHHLIPFNISLVKSQMLLSMQCNCNHAQAF